MAQPEQKSGQVLVRTPMSSSTEILANFLSQPNIGPNQAWQGFWIRLQIFLFQKADRF
jgi:hypothetical protein